MTTLITGASIIGCHTARLLAERGEAVELMDLRPARDAIASITQHPLVSVVEGDVTDFEALLARVRERGVRRIVHTAALRYAAVIGAWSGPGTSVPSKVLTSLLVPARRGETAVMDDPYAVWKGGDEYIDARDCALANVAALDATAPTQGVYFIGLGRHASFDEFVAAVRALHPALQVRLAVEPGGGFAGFPHVRSAASDISAAARELGWTPAYSLADSVRHFAPLLG